MDFSIPEPLQETLARIRHFVATELFPLEEGGVERPWAELLPLLEGKRQKVKSMGLWLPQIAKAWGGGGFSVQEHGLVSQELGQSPFGHYCFGCQAPDAGNMEVLIEYGTPEQQERFLRPLLAGKIRSCFSMTEPEHAGSNPVWMSTTAVADGDHYVIDGHKWFTSSADGAAFAVVMAVTNPDAEPHRRASMILVPTDTPGFELVRNVPVMGHHGEGWPSHAEIRYTGCRVPKANLLGSEGAGFALSLIHI